MKTQLLLFPIAAALFYALSVIFAKIASKKGSVSPTSMLAATNLAIMFVFLPFVFLSSDIDFTHIWRPAIVGLFFALGNYATFLCAKYGQVSLMTPIMGVKILFVFATASALSGILPSAEVFLSGVICAIAVFIMGYDKELLCGSSKIGKTLALALSTCFFYAVCDVLVQQLSGKYSPCVFLGLTSVFLAISSAPAVPKMFREFLSGGKTTLIAVLAAAFMAMESTLMFIALANNLDAGLCNIVYNIRGVMSVVLVYFMSGAYPELEHLSRSSAGRRLLGSFMILGAIALVVF